MTQNALEIDYGPQDRKQELEEFLSTVAEDLSDEQKQRALELAREITEQDGDEMSTALKIDTAHFYAQVAREMVANLDDEQRLQIIQDLDELIVDDRENLDALEMPMLLEIAEAQEMLALAIEQEVIGEVEIQAEVVARVQVIVGELSDAAEKIYDESEKYEGYF